TRSDRDWSSDVCSSDLIQGGQDGHTNDGSTNQINNYHDIQEVVAVAVNNSAEFARVGYYDMTTKAGGNKLHVDLAYWHQNSSLRSEERRVGTERRAWVS